MARILHPYERPIPKQAARTPGVRPRTARYRRPRPTRRRGGEGDRAHRRECPRRETTALVVKQLPDTRARPPSIRILRRVAVRRARPPGRAVPRVRRAIGETGVRVCDDCRHASERPAGPNRRARPDETAPEPSKLTPIRRLVPLGQPLHRRCGSPDDSEDTVKATAARSPRGRSEVTPGLQLSIPRGWPLRVARHHDHRILLAGSAGAPFSWIASRKYQTDAAASHKARPRSGGGPPTVRT
jgi:hypothetical protein